MRNNLRYCASLVLWYCSCIFSYVKCLFPHMKIPAKHKVRETMEEKYEKYCIKRSVNWKKVLCF